MNIKIIISGRGYDLAEQLPQTIELIDDADVKTAIQQLSGLLAEDKQFSPNSLISLSGKHLGSLADYENRTLNEGDELAIIAPVAGG